MGKRSKAAAVESEEESPTPQPPSKKKAPPPQQEEGGGGEENMNVSSEVAATTGTSSTNELSYSEKCAFASPIAQPMAGKKLTKKLLKLIRKACKHKNHFRSGLRDVQTRIRKGEKGICIFAADVTPVDVMCHLPAVCEDSGIPYAFVPMRTDISQAMAVRRPTMMALIVDTTTAAAAAAATDYQDLYQECMDGIRSLHQQ